MLVLWRPRGIGRFLRTTSTSVRLMVGRSAIVNTGWPIARVSLTSADVADAHGHAAQPAADPGQGAGHDLDVRVGSRRRDAHATTSRSNATCRGSPQQVRELFPGEPITVEGNGKSIVVAGKVATKYIAEKAVEVAAGYVDKKDDVVSLLQVRDPGPTPQVLLRVRFAEVSRNALTELGASFFTGANGYKDFVGRVTTQQFPAPIFDNQNGENKLVFSDFLNLFVFDLKNQLGAVIKALQTQGLFQSLAEPNLVAESGKEASFLAGGEFPIPVAQGGGANLSISVVFKEFGIRLNFTPTVTGTGRVRLKVRPEVSTLDFSNAIVSQGFRIPALSTRRTETEIELQDGQTFAIAGLLNNTATQSMQKVPGHRRHPDSRTAVPQQGRAETADRAGRDDHAADSDPHSSGVTSGAAAHDRAVPAAARSGEDLPGAAAGVHDAAAPGRRGAPARASDNHSDPDVDAGRNADADPGRIRRGAR